MNVLFVCTGNTCRSPMAEAITRHLAADLSMQIEVHSAGLRAESTIAQPAVQVLRTRDIQVDEERPAVQLSEEMVARASLVLCAAAEHRNVVVEAVPASASRVLVWGDLVARATTMEEHLDLHRLLEHLAAGEPVPDQDLPDPLGQGRLVYEGTAARIEEYAAATLKLLSHYRR